MSNYPQSTDEILDTILDESYNAGIDASIEVILSSGHGSNPVVTRFLNKIITQLNELKNEIKQD